MAFPLHVWELHEPSATLSSPAPRNKTLSPVHITTGPTVLFFTYIIPWQKAWIPDSGWEEERSTWMVLQQLGSWRTKGEKKKKHKLIQV